MSEPEPDPLFQNLLTADSKTELVEIVAAALFASGVALCVLIRPQHWVVPALATLLLGLALSRWAVSLRKRRPPNEPGAGADANAPIPHQPETGAAGSLAIADRANAPAVPADLPLRGVEPAAARRDERPPGEAPAGGLQPSAAV